PIDVFAGGLSDQAGEIRLHESWRLGHSSFGAHHHHLRDRVEPIVRGDQWLESLGVAAIDALVLDVEGWEVHALNGLTGVIDNSPGCRALVEVSEWALTTAGHTRADLFGFWRSHRFEMRWATHYGAGHEFGVWGDIVTDDGPRLAGDILCYRPDTASIS